MQRPFFLDNADQLSGTACLYLGKGSLNVVIAVFSSDCVGITVGVVVVES